MSVPAQTASLACHPFRLFAKSLRARGYQIEPPPWLAVEALMADAETISEGSCECCRGALSFRAAHHPGRQEYLALAVCVRCQHAEEF
jgi:hypothetical protein